MLQAQVRSRLRRTRRSFATAIRTLKSETDYKRWRNPADPAYRTADRNEIIGRFVPRGSSVLDLGAGTQELRHQIPADCEYQPCGLLPGPDVLPCDFNSGRYPAVKHRYDIVVASGLVEFLRRPDHFLARLPEFGDVLLMSYRVRPRGEGLGRRLASGYLNHMTQEQLEALLSRCFDRWEQVAEYEFTGTDAHHVQPIYRVALAPSPS